ncbi:hypothetical protein PQU94_11085 [Asticcacaulis sp. DXS10W]|uniref:Uncharacterized protein n=1 Tax=Asticcacaulis currens TaxID=2984210 RepID=A0ABT5IF88_9CAUL|nr:hypothetical protein [Asticcacaulis currens]MDC7694824.1 hypothetical protein [Asticcacaulis currens]
MKDAKNQMHRRSFLFAAPALGVAIAPQIAQSAAPALSASDRARYHLSEFQKAMQEADTSIACWEVIDRPHGGADQLAFIMQAHRVTDRYSGPGLYAVNKRSLSPQAPATRGDWSPRVWVEDTGLTTSAGEPILKVKNDYSIEWHRRDTREEPPSWRVAKSQFEAICSGKV